MGSVDTSISDLVTIIVKAPNQQIADQTIQCHLNWTIKKLKDYLSQVYPSKPKMEEQKLIYSGKLLTDSAVLKDILRTYEGQENHTVHLVCLTKPQKLSKMSSSTNTSSIRSENNSLNVTNSDQHRDNSQARNQQHPIPNAGTIPLAGSQAPSFDQFNTNQFPQFPAHNFDPRYFWPSATAFMNVNDVDANQQFAYMQQAYAQYLSQYMQMIGQPGLAHMTSPISQPVRTSLSPTLPNNGLPNVRVNEEGNAVRENPPAVGAMGNDIDDEEGRNNRDWLDWFYVFSRVVVLFSVVYFYSTPLRLLAVVLLVCMFYLHQNMRMHNDHVNLNVINNNNNNAINHNNQNNNNRAENVAENVGLRQRLPSDQDTHRRNEEPNPVSEDVTPPTQSTSPPAPERLSPITVTLLAIRSFFVSLVPDHPVV